MALSLYLLYIFKSESKIQGNKKIIYVKFLIYKLLVHYSTKMYV